MGSNLFAKKEKIETKDTSYSHFKFSAFAITEQDIFYLDASRTLWEEGDEGKWTHSLGGSKKKK